MGRSYEYGCAESQTDPGTADESWYWVLYEWTAVFGGVLCFGHDWEGGVEYVAYVC